MTAYAPQPIRDLATWITANVGGTFSGIVGDINHSFGYHLARNDLPSSDYSVAECPEDKLGDGWAASALDISFPPALMKTVTARLKHSADDVNDPRLNGIREFAGTLNGTDVFNYDTYFRQTGINQWDDSHLWHVHISFIRKYSNTVTVMQDVFRVVKGEPNQPVIPPTPPRKEIDMLLVTVDKATVPSGEKWPGIFLMDSTTKLHHVTDTASYNGYKAALPGATITYSEYVERLGA
jgi:hypothetical protein